MPVVLKMRLPFPPAQPNFFSDLTEKLSQIFELDSETVTTAFSLEFPSRASSLAAQLLSIHGVPSS